MKHLFFLWFSFFSALSLIAQIDVTSRIKSDSLKNAFQVISEKEKPGGAGVTFHQDKRIEKAVTATVSNTGALMPGFRVQVFSSNTQRTARQEAFNHESNLKEAFPEMKIYVSYNSPFWKVRIGDFTTQEDARKFTEELLQRFPELKGETYTVRDNISVPAK
ncbi:MAG: SPOR domain-containing protein [Paludibacter sp.]|nr:SPOR domain-containing protein [Paludibacter sp.]